jgi:uncharacterized membrane protein YphA (DoxX/SURF4 family)
MKRAKEYAFLTMVLLVALRLAIGWHFLYEGYHKLDSFVRGETTTSKPWTSAGYFREAPGPLAREMRQVVGDPDDDALARLTVQPPPAGEDPPAAKPYLRTPPGLKKDWDDYFDQYAKAYNLDSSQRNLAQAKLEQAESNVVEWLTLKWDPARPRKAPDDDAELKNLEKAGLKAVERPAPSGNATIKVLQTAAERVQEYRNKVQEYRDMLDVTDATLGADVVGAKRLAAKAEAAAMRSSLLADLDKKTADFRELLASILPPDKAAVPFLAASTFGVLGSPMGQGPLVAASALFPGRSVPPLAPPPPETSTPVIWWLDRATAWGLAIIGGCLLVGLLSRTNCVLAAGFLLMTYFAAPPWPWLPTPPNNEGNYLFINKNVIEMIALLALATTASGRWFGVDALIHWAFGALLGRKAPRPVPVRKAA